MELEGKAALITGGARVGAAVAEVLAARGCAIAMTYRRSRAKVEATAKAVRVGGARCELIETDLSDPKALDAVVPAVEKAFGRLDILINMASNYDEHPVEELAKSGVGPWDASLDVDARAAFALSLRAAPLMRRAGAGRIINFSDWLAASARPRYPGWATYYSAKAAVQGLTEALALELAPDILVNAIAPGPTIPAEGMSQAAIEESIRQTPLRRWSGSGEIAKAVLFIVDSDYMTGEILRVDGGRHLY